MSYSPRGKGDFSRELFYPALPDVRLRTRETAMRRADAVCIALLATSAPIVSAQGGEGHAKSLPPFPPPPPGYCQRVDDIFDAVAAKCPSQTVERLLKRGASPNAMKDSTPVLRRAVTIGDVDTIRLLLEAGADLALGDAGVVTLCRAAGDTEVLHLLAARISVETVRGEHECNPLVEATKAENAAGVAILLEAGFPVSQPDRSGLMPLNAAVIRGHDEITAKLLQAGAGVNDAGPDGRTALHFVTCREGVELATKLIGLGADPDLRDKRGRTTLMYAAVRNDSTGVKFFLGQGVEVDAQDAEGNTALHFASRCGSIDAISALLDAGATTESRNALGEIPADVADETARAKIVRMLTTSRGDSRDTIE